jgi:uncharacterized protein (DUF885 family)
VTDFDRLVAALLDEECAADPPRATRLGIPGHDADLPDLSARAVAEGRRREEDWAARFAALAEPALSAEEQVDRDLIGMTLRGRAILRNWGDWQRNAECYLDPAVDGVFSLFLHRSAPEAELVSSAVARLRRLPDLLAQARANLDPDLAAPLLVGRAVEHALGAVTYLRESLPAEAPDFPELAAAAASAADHVAKHASWLRDFRGRARGCWKLGEQSYSALLTEAEGLGYGAAELARRGQAAYDELSVRLRDRARELDSDDWRVRLAADAPPTLEAMRAEYAEWTARARAFCVQRGLVTLPDGERCVVTSAPPYSRAVIAVAFYVQPPPFGRGRVGFFFVPFTPAGASPEQVRQRLASNSRMTIPTTAVHEAYPGHHWHLAWLGSACTRPIRQVFSSAYLVEGWALYAEQLLADEGFFTDPVAQIGQLAARLFRAARVVVDAALHTGEMTVEQAAGFLTDELGLSAETARAEAVRYCALPTQAASYLTGAIEIGRMREEWMARGGGLREFHDRLAGSGMLPLGLAERVVFAAS